MTAVSTDSMLMGLVLGGEIIILIAITRIWKSLKERKNSKQQGKWKNTIQRQTKNGLKGKE